MQERCLGSCRYAIRCHRLGPANHGRHFLCHDHAHQTGLLPRCESCGALAEVELDDHSKWCMPCHGSALRLGHDTELGHLLGVDP
jgi:hypothetical protein